MVTQQQPHHQRMGRRLVLTMTPLLLLVVLFPLASLGLSSTAARTSRRTCSVWADPAAARCFYGNTVCRPNTALFSKKQSKSSDLLSAEAALLEKEETPAGIAGAEVFGGNRQKEELFDATAERNSNVVLAEGGSVYNRINDMASFSTSTARKVAKSLQHQINAVLYDDEKENDDKDGDEDVVYDDNLIWKTPFSVDKLSKNPLQELDKALDFYKRIDVALISTTHPEPGTVVVRWEISVVWPNFWEARVLLTGTSTLTLSAEENKIIKQVDTLDEGNDLLQAVGPQVALPKFWDTYHIGMTPSAQTMPRLDCSKNVKKGLLSTFSLFEIPPRLVLRPSLLDIGTREDAYAQVIPNHAFTTTIKTMGPQRQRYVTTSPVEIQISRNSGGETRITWTIPLAVEFASSTELPIPGDDVETPEEASAECVYEYQLRRRVATLPFGGPPQDSSVATVRKQLYDQVVKDGLKPKLDDDGRPIFFYLQNDAKACFTSEGGLGMGVYDWRPEFVKANEVGMELEI